jgi:hypothetical protein
LAQAELSSGHGELLPDFLSKPIDIVTHLAECLDRWRWRSLHPFPTTRWAVCTSSTAKSLEPIPTSPMEAAAAGHVGQ